MSRSATAFKSDSCRPGDSAATPTDTVKVRSICAVSATGCAEMHSRMRSASFAASMALVSGRRMASSSPPNRAALRLDALPDLLQRDVTREVAVAVVDSLEVIDVHHQARDASRPPLRTGQLFFQALLQVA